MIVADGLILFLAQDDFVSLLNRLTAHFPGGELALNAYTTYAMWTLSTSALCGRSRAAWPIPVSTTPGTSNSGSMD